MVMMSVCCALKLQIIKVLRFENKTLCLSVIFYIQPDLREKEGRKKGGWGWGGGGGGGERGGREGGRGAWKGEGRDNFILGLISEECTDTPSLN